MIFSIIFDSGVCCWTSDRGTLPGRKPARVKFF